MPYQLRDPHIQPICPNYAPTVQRKAVKLISDGKKSDHVTPYYSILNILKLQDLYMHEIAKIVF